MLSIVFAIFLSLLVIVTNLYAVKHGFAMWKYEKNRLGAIGIWLASAASIAISVYMLVQRI